MYGSVVLVIPCYNEACRLDVEEFADVAAQMPNLRLLFVDDGSDDGTGDILDELVDRLGEDVSTVLSLHANVGKAEAVRRGILAALELESSDTDQGPVAVGFWDADLATPLTDVAELASVLFQRPEVVGVIGSRVRLMGHRIERRALRHYTGRVFATLASITLGFPVYDTQCGSKLFRVTSDLPRVFNRPFASTWAFDVEVLARLASIYGRNLGQKQFVLECPLQQWTDVPGSKVRVSHVPRMVLDLVRIVLRYRLNETEL